MTEAAVQLSKTLRDEGNELFKVNNIEGAMTKYNEAFQAVENIAAENESNKQLLEQAKMFCYLNRAVIYRRQCEYEKVVTECNLALLIENKNVKGLLRRGDAYIQLNKLDEANQDLNTVKELDPQIKVDRLFELLKRKEKTKAKQQEKELYQAMMKEIAHNEKDDKSNKVENNNNKVETKKLGEEEESGNIKNSGNDDSDSDSGDEGLSKLQPLYLDEELE